MEAKKNISTVERRTLIIEKLDAEGQLDVTSLSKELGVSEVTIRNDLNWLEQKNMLVRARGGAIKAERVATEVSLTEKNKLHYQEKTEDREICRSSYRKRRYHHFRFRDDHNGNQ